MPYEFLPNRMYRMPTHFGPRTGPRQGENGRHFDNKETPKSTSIAVSFLSTTEHLDRLLPPGFHLHGEPVVTVTATYMTEIEWLAGRGYNTLGVSFAATYQGAEEQVTGNFLAVLWENLADPIITGREELGYAKIYGELPAPVVLGSRWSATASWLGFRFFELAIDELRQQSEQEIADVAGAQTGAGTLHYKYMPRTGEWGTADVAYATLTPAATPNRIIQERWVGQGALQFHHARWEDMPTQFNIVNTLHALPIVEYRSASITKTVGGKDLRDVRILR